jgi:hypothetical protein
MRAASSAQVGVGCSVPSPAACSMLFRCLIVAWLAAYEKRVLSKRRVTQMKPEPRLEFKGSKLR